MKILRQIGAVLLGLIVGFLAVAGIEMISSLQNPMPQNAANDPEALKEWIRSLPTSAFLIVIAAWIVGGFAGPFTARSVAANKSLRPPLIVAGLFLLSIIANLSMIPHPIWMWPAALLLVPIAILAGLIVSSPRDFETRSEVLINAPLESVYKTVSLPDEYSQAIPDIQSIEVVSDTKSGVGTRFRETRLMNGKPAIAELEVTEQSTNDCIRLVSIAGGAKWDSLFVVAQEKNQTKLTLQMVATPVSLLGKLFVPLLLGMIAKAVASDMQSVKVYCETKADR